MDIFQGIREGPGAPGSAAKHIAVGEVTSKEIQKARRKALRTSSDSVSVLSSNLKPKTRTRDEAPSFEAATMRQERTSAEMASAFPDPCNEPKRCNDGTNMQSVAVATKRKLERSTSKTHIPCGGGRDTAQAVTNGTPRDTPAATTATTSPAHRRAQLAAAASDTAAAAAPTAAAASAAAAHTSNLKPIGFTSIHCSTSSPHLPKGLSSPAETAHAVSCGSLGDATGGGGDTNSSPSKRRRAAAGPHPPLIQTAADDLSPPAAAAARPAGPHPPLLHPAARYPDRPTHIAHGRPSPALPAAADHPPGAAAAAAAAGALPPGQLDPYEALGAAAAADGPPAGVMYTMPPNMVCVGMPHHVAGGGVAAFPPPFYVVGAAPRWAAPAGCWPPPVGHLLSPYAPAGPAGGAGPAIVYGLGPAAAAAAAPGGFHFAQPQLAAAGYPHGISAYQGITAYPSPGMSGYPGIASFPVYFPMQPAVPANQLMQPFL